MWGVFLYTREEEADADAAEAAAMARSHGWWNHHHKRIGLICFTCDKCEYIWNKIVGTRELVRNLIFLFSATSNTEELVGGLKCFEFSIFGLFGMDLGNNETDWRVRHWESFGETVRILGRTMFDFPKMVIKQGHLAPQHERRQNGTQKELNFVSTYHLWPLHFS